MDNMWETKSISQLVKIIGGGTPKTSIDEYWGGNIPWISIKDFNNDLKYVKTTEKTITESGLKNSSTKILKKGDMIISARGTVGELAMIPSDMAFNQSCYGIVPHNFADNEFIYYLLKYNLNKLKNNTHGSVFDTITTNTFDSIIVNIPNLNCQKKISKILSDIDDKIETNNKINNNLEHLLSACLKEVFRFDKLNTKLKHTEEFGDIPENWSVEYLLDHVDFIRGFEPGSDNYHENNIHNDENLIKFYRVGDLKNPNSPVFIEEQLVDKTKTIIEEDVVVSLDATIGIVTMGLNGSFSSGMRKIVLKNNKINKAFVYSLLKTEHIQNILKTYASGTTILHASKSLNYITFLLPDDERMKKYMETTSPMLDIILSNTAEIEKLTKLRDTLIPKLMSGEIDVSDINFDLETEE